MKGISFDQVRISKIWLRQINIWCVWLLLNGIWVHASFFFLFICLSALSTLPYTFLHSPNNNRGNEYSSRLIYDFNKLLRIQMDFQLWSIWRKCASRNAHQMEWNVHFCVQINPKLGSLFLVNPVAFPTHFIHVRIKWNEIFTYF